jgi:tRNA uridine 5-carboxymethylaminomethyl modification enzyme
MLNKSKGPAMWSPRAQCDRVKFSIEWRSILEKTENLDIWQEQVVKLLFEENRLVGVETIFENKLYAKAVILTVGTFLNGLMHVGLQNAKGGRSGDQESVGLSEQLLKLGFTVDRLKTGTSARVDGRTIDFSVMTEQPGDDEIKSFSFCDSGVDRLPQRSCYLTHTNKKTHDILRSGLEYSPMFTGRIKGRGPRYCPSVEDKIVTFSLKDSHPLFIEPEGADTIEYYVNGFSSSLPMEIQLSALRKVQGLENVKIFRPGYAVEYDFFQPTQLKSTLETKLIENLYFAGQINGTTGYEEAAAQGLMAGINAVQRLKNLPPFVLGREEAYIGVLIDDLITKGVDEPYRMFTSRAEYRILLRQDNADERLMRKAFELGCIEKSRLDKLENKEKAVEAILNFLSSTSVAPDTINAFLESVNTSAIFQKMKALNIATRPQVEIKTLLSLLGYIGVDNWDEITESSEIKIKYEGYLQREKQIAEKIRRLEDVKIPASFNYSDINSISTEGRQKLTKIKPDNIGQASRISGVSPADINILLMYLGR